jgi:SAM-dependent methyltransferase
MWNKWRGRDETRDGLPMGWGIERPKLHNLDYCLVRAGLARMVQAACDRWREDLPSGGCLLDVGCGSQPYKQSVERAGLRYVGIDWPESIHCAQSSVIEWDLTKTPWPFPDGAFDAILCTEVIEHLPNPRRAMEECARVCRAGSLILLTAPLTWPEHEIPHDYYRFTRHGLRVLLEGAGFSIQEIAPRGGWPIVIAQLLGFWSCHGFEAPWNLLTRLVALPIVTLLSGLERFVGPRSPLLLTLGFAAFARRTPTTQAQKT